MIRTHVVGSWSARDTTVEDIDEAIRMVRARHPRGQVRAAVASLVVHIGNDAAAASAVLRVIREVAASTPMHAVVVSTLPDAAPGIDAEVTVLAAERAGGSRVCGEDVVLQVRGPAGDHLGSVVGPCTLRGVPVVAWFPMRPPHPDDELVALADRVLVDSRRGEAATTLRECLELSRRRPVTDLGWVALEPWRQVLARLLDVSPFDASDRGVGRIDAEGATARELLLTGWLLNGADLGPEVVRVVDAERPALRLWSAQDGRRASISVDSPVGSTGVRGVVLRGAPGLSPRTLVMPIPSAAAVLQRALDGRARDAAWEDALVAALGLVVRS